MPTPAWAGDSVVYFSIAEQMASTEDVSSSPIARWQSNMVDFHVRDARLPMLMGALSTAATSIHVSQPTSGRKIDDYAFSGTYLEFFQDLQTKFNVDTVLLGNKAYVFETAARRTTAVNCPDAELVSKLIGTEISASSVHAENGTKRSAPLLVPSEIAGRINSDCGPNQAQMGPSFLSLIKAGVVSNPPDQRR